MQPALGNKFRLDTVAPSRERILKTAKALFALKGYEHATTSAIARNAATSETQLMKYFGSKQGILEAIFTEGWTKVLENARNEIHNVSSPKEKLGTILRVVMAVMETDPELKLLMLLEGRRIRKDAPMLMLTDTFLSFVKMVDDTLEELRSAGMIRLDLDVQAVRSAIMGMLEGMLRDSFLAQTAGYPANYSATEMGKIFALVLDSFAGCEPKGQLTQS